jgi:hypothetical protein
MGEDPFLARVKELMTTDDYLVVDATTKGGNWTQNGDIVGDPNAYPEGWSEFFSLGFSRKIGEPLEDVAGKRLLKDYKTRISCVPGRETFVRGATTFLVKDTLTNRHIYKFTRYDYGKLRSWLVDDQHFTIVGPDERRPRNDGTNTELCVLVCKKTR